MCESQHNRDRRYLVKWSISYRCVIVWLNVVNCFALIRNLLCRHGIIYVLYIKTTSDRKELFPATCCFYNNDVLFLFRRIVENLSNSRHLIGYIKIKIFVFSEILVELLFVHKLRCENKLKLWLCCGFIVVLLLNYIKHLFVILFYIVKTTIFAVDL